MMTLNYGHIHNDDRHSIYRVCRNVYYCKMPLDNEKMITDLRSEPI